MQVIAARCRQAFTAYMDASAGLKVISFRVDPMAASREERGFLQIPKQGQTRPATGINGKRVKKQQNHKLLIYNY